VVFMDVKIIYKTAERYFSNRGFKIITEPNPQYSNLKYSVDYIQNISHTVDSIVDPKKKENRFAKKEMQGYFNYPVE